MALRIQRKRSKGWKMPEGAVYVGRPSKWGNPVKVGRLFCAEIAKEIYSYLVWPHEEGEDGLGNRAKFGMRIARANWKPVTIGEIISELRGKNLACWCALDQPCHADFLLEIANEEEKHGK